MFIPLWLLIVAGIPLLFFAGVGAAFAWHMKPWQRF